MGLLFSSKVFAESNGLNLELNWPQSPGPSNLTLNSDATLITLIEYGFEWAVVIGMVALLGTIIYTSLIYIISAGNAKRISAAKRRMRSAFLGAGILLSSWLFLSMLNPELAIISEISVTGGRLDEEEASIEEQMTERQEKQDRCDYALVDYQDQTTKFMEKGESPKEAQEEDHPALLYSGEVKMQKILPMATIACNNKQDLISDAVSLDGEKAIKFVEGEPVSRYETDYQPKCEEEIDCIKGGFGKDDDPCYAPLEDVKEGPIQYCYTTREFAIPTSHPSATKSFTEGTVQFISQKHIVSSRTTCLAGDTKLVDGGGCSLDLFHQQMTARCSDKQLSTNATTYNIRSTTFDNQITCMELNQQRY